MTACHLLRLKFLGYYKSKFDFNSLTDDGYLDDSNLCLPMCNYPASDCPPHHHKGDQWPQDIVSAS